MATSRKNIILLSIALLSLSTITLAAYWRTLNPPMQPRETDWFEAGMRQINIGGYYPAYEQFRRVLSINPNNLSARKLREIANLRGFYFWSIDSSRALEKFLQLELQYPEEPFLLTRGAEIYFDLNDYDHALKLYEEVIRLQPNIPQTYYGMGLTYQKIGNRDLSLQFLSQAADIAPKGIYLDALAQEHFFQSSYSDASLSFNKAVDEDWWRLSSHLGLIRSLLFAGQYSEAISAADETLLLFLKKPSVLNKFNQDLNLLYMVEDTAKLNKASLEAVVSYISELKSLSVTQSSNPKASKILRVSKVDPSMAEVIAFDNQILSRK